jgi:hypothetical protein
MPMETLRTMTQDDRYYPQHFGRMPLRSPADLTHIMQPSVIVLKPVQQAPESQEDEAKADVGDVVINAAGEFAAGVQNEMQILFGALPSAIHARLELAREQSATNSSSQLLIAQRLAARNAALRNNNANVVQFPTSIDGASDYTAGFDAQAA